MKRVRKPKDLSSLGKDDTYATGQVENTASISVVFFVTAGITLFRLCYEAASMIMLVRIYGLERVFHEHLSIVKYKPHWTISNGDIIFGKGPVHFLIGASMWLLSTALFIISTYRFLPQREREALGGHYTVSVTAMIVSIGVFFGIGLLPLKYSLLLGVFVLAVAFLLPWIRDEN